MYKNIIFDMGNVLFWFEPKKYVEELGLTNEEEKHKVYIATYHTVKNALFDQGFYDEQKMIDAICEDIGEGYRKHIEKLVLHWNDTLNPVEGMASLIKELKDKGYKIYLLSNAAYMQHEYWGRVPGSEYFDGTLISCDVKYIKPEPEIYEALYDKFNIKPSESFFIDDLVINIFGAKKTGMDGYVFDGNVNRLRSEFKKLGIL